MVKPRDHLAQGFLEDTEIDEHSPLAQYLSRCPSPHPVIVTVQALALAVVMNKPMRCGKPGLYPHFVHS